MRPSRWVVLAMLCCCPSRDWLLARIACGRARCHSAGLRAELALRGTKVSNDAVWRFLRGARLTFQKSLRAAEQDRQEVARKRERWKRYQSRVVSVRSRRLARRAVWRSALDHGG